MKKLLTGFVFAAFALSICAAVNDTSKARTERISMQTYTNALPKKDTKRKDCLQSQSFVFNIVDTLPVKKDTTRKNTMFSSAVAYRLVNDTLPHRDTARKDTSIQMLAFNR